ncbi:glucose-1-phosphate cytidylyltransferase [Brevibacillus brevis]|uniref:glucose-1-phosphate cytidylyltransferase n=1 Tax=Brevibacillus brevis TaxID=1393 RepID=UPI000B395BB0|nr:glucose-1-phosphate cytidylyltransferase [Brevibacillus brevis]OUQ86823.1 glucose-1-phosphate cytidylyltransferase [Brevibacillus brevis]
MKVVILAGGYGTRIGEETHLRPKPLIEIGDWPIICHIMSIYSKYGFHDFIICLGYKGYMIKEYFAHYFLHHSDVTFDFRNDNQVTFHNHNAAPWRVTLIDTGKDTGTGGRVKRIQKYVGEDTFMLTYGDGLSDINIEQLVKFHRTHKKLATITTTQPPGRFGALDIANGNTVTGFQEKPKGDGGWINAGFFVMEPGVFDYMTGDETVLEKEPLEDLAKANQLMAFKHTGFWQPMDTLRDKNYLEELWKSGKAAWASSRT